MTEGMPTNFSETSLESAAEIVEICQRLYARNCLAAADGNVSVRLSADEILITPSGRAKAFLNPTDLVTMDLQGREQAGRASSEKLMHLKIYQQCPLARAVVHAHPPTAIALTLAFPEWQEIPNDCLSELILAVGRLPIAPFARPGTAAMGDVLQPFLPDHRVICLARHGALAWGETLEEAYWGLERLEHSATILHRALQLGELSRLPAAEMEALRTLRNQLGPRTL